MIINNLEVWVTQKGPHDPHRSGSDCDCFLISGRSVVQEGRLAAASLMSLPFPELATQGSPGRGGLP